MAGPNDDTPKFLQTERDRQQARSTRSTGSPELPARDGEAGEPTDDGDGQTVATFFVYKPLWFVLAQTEGQPLPEPRTASWDRVAALAALNVTEVPFDAMNGNVMGFARDRSIAVNPVNPMPHKTRFHELAHVLLGHTAEGTLNDDERTPRNLRECEAESVALLCCAALNLPGVEFSRGYIQSDRGQESDALPTWAKSRRRHTP